jgi:hypothetical protein
MSRRDRAEALHDVAVVRELRSLAAEAAALRAAEAGRVLNTRRAGEAELGLKEQEGWASAMSAPAFDPQLAGFWSAALSARAEALRAIDEEIRARDAETRTRSAQWRTAQVLADSAAQDARSALARYRRHKEDSELADRCGVRTERRP